jgi:hypothetical protein
MPNAEQVRTGREKKVLSCKGYFLGGARLYIFHESDSVTRVERFHSLSFVLYSAIQTVGPASSACRRRTEIS